jgi:hypothetical protein
MDSSHLWLRFPLSYGRGGYDGESKTPAEDRKCIPSVQSILLLAGYLIPENVSDLQCNTIRMFLIV